MRYLFVCSAGNFPEIGTGHFVRMRDIAERVENKSNPLDTVEIDFLGNISESHLKTISKYNFHKVSNINVDAEDLNRILSFKSYDVIIFDNLDLNFSKSIRENCPGTIIITIDNLISNSDFDLQIFSTLSNKQVPTNLRYVAFPEPKIADIKSQKVNKSFQIFCSFGGFDSKSFSKKIIKWLNSNVDCLDAIWIFAIGNNEHLHSVLNSEKLPNIKFIESQYDFFYYLNTSDLLIISGGLTMYQSLYLGKPTLVFPQYEHQYESATKLAKKNACQIVSFKENDEDLLVFSDILKSLTRSPEILEKLSFCARKAVPDNEIDRIAEIALVYEFLTWDSDFFGFPIAKITTPQINQNIIDFVLKKVAKDKVKCIYYLDSGNSYESIELAEKNNFNLVDTRITFEKFFDLDPKNNLDDNCRFATLEDFPAIKEITNDAYLLSRYFFDPNFPKKKCQLFYTEWVYKSIIGQLDDFVIVYEINHVILGFISAKISRNVATIGLIGVKEEFRGQHIGEKLLMHLQSCLQDKNIVLLRVVTQARNISAQRLYVKNGFQPVKFENWYHRWS